MARHIRKDDQVQILAGKNRGRQGRVLRVIPDRINSNRDRVVIEGINVGRKYVRPTQDNPQGGSVEKEMSIHISNVLPLANGKPSRVRFQKKEDGSKIRVASRTNKQLGEPIKKPR